PSTATNTTLNGGMRVHFWLRLSSTPQPSPSVARYQAYIQGGNASGFNGQFDFAPNTLLPDNQWHEVVLDVSGAYNVVDRTPYMADVWRVGVQLLVANRPVPEAGAGEGGAGEAGAVEGGSVEAGSGEGGVEAGLESGVSLDANFDGGVSVDTGLSDSAQA